MILNVPFKVRQWQEDDGTWIIHCKEFDISGYGKTKTEARESFIIAVEEFLSMAVEEINYDNLLNPESN